MPNFVLKNTSVLDSPDNIYLLSHDNKSMEAFKAEVSIIMDLVKDAHNQILIEDEISDYTSIDNSFLTDIALLIMKDNLKYSINPSIEILNLLADDPSTSMTVISGIEEVLERQTLETEKYTRYLTKVNSMITETRIVLNRMK